MGNDLILTFLISASPLFVAGLVGICLVLSFLFLKKLRSLPGTLFFLLPGSLLTAMSLVGSIFILSQTQKLLNDFEKETTAQILSRQDEIVGFIMSGRYIEIGSLLESIAKSANLSELTLYSANDQLIAKFPNLYIKNSSTKGSIFELYKKDIDGSNTLWGKIRFISDYKQMSVWSSNIRQRWTDLSILAVLIVLLFAAFAAWLIQRQTKSLSMSLNSLENKIKNSTSPEELANSLMGGLTNNLNLNEETGLHKSLYFIGKLVHNLHKKSMDLEIAVQISQVASQVSHDIRSPLAALNMILGQLQNMPEQQRVIIRNSVNRINDIANTLLSKSKEHSLSHSLSQSTESSSNTNIQTSTENSFNLNVELLPALIDNIVSEKRIQFREKINIEIEADLHESYGAFANINATELKRTISNLLNNSCEALPESKGKIIVSVKNGSQSIILTVKDNGKGIPKHILDKLGQIGVTHGKEETQSGSGIGVYHAKKTIESFGGQFRIESEEGNGAATIMTFPKAEAPSWFVNKLYLEPKSYIISIDDDLSIHGIWGERFLKADISKHQIQHLTFTSASEFKTWCNLNKPSSNTIFLMDYELLNQNITGLDLIEEHRISNQSILVTSRYEEVQIKNRCQRLGVRLIPKGMAEFVPIVLEKPKELLDGVLLEDDEIVNRPKITQQASTEVPLEKIKYDLCLLDDDRTLIHTLWEMVAKTKGHNIKMFSTPEEFQFAADSIDRETPIFIDVSLDNGVSGVDFSEVVHKMGFLNINLATGYSADSIKVPTFIGRIIGKDYPEFI